MHKFGKRSIFSGTADRRITVARWDKDSPAGIDNLIVCTSAEAGAHSRRDLKDYHDSFVTHVEKNLLLRQDVPVDTQDVPIDTQDTLTIYEQPYPPLRINTSPGRTNLTQLLANWNFRKYGNISPAKKTWVCLTRQC